MKKLLFLGAFCLSLPALAQRENSLAVSILGRWDQHADYRVLGPGSSTQRFRLSGKGFGGSLRYGHPLSRQLKLTVGAGYHRLYVDEIRMFAANWMAWTRPVLYPHPLGGTNLETEHYRYNNISFSAGFSWQKKIGEKWDLTAGAEAAWLYTFSQLYQLTYNFTEYRTGNGRTLGYGVNAYLGVARRIGRQGWYVQPQFLLPVYQRLHGDRVLLEEEHVKTSQVWGGSGGMLTVGRYF